MSARARPGGRARTKGPHHFGTAVVLAKLKEYGLLLQTDVNLPNVCALVAGAPVRGSWWGHPRSHEIFRVNCELAEHPDVLMCKLVSGKITYFHRALWPAVIAIGRARVHILTVATRNVRHFKGLDVELLNPFTYTA